MQKRQDENQLEEINEISMLTRRQFVGVASSAALSTLVLPGAFAARLPAGGSAEAFKPHLLQPADTIWASLEAMNQNGAPRFTGNDAHRRSIDMYHSGLQEAGLDVARDSYTFPRWEVRKWSLSATPAGGSRMDLPVTFYYPHSGQTGPEGVTGTLACVGKIASDGSSKPDLSGDLTGKILLVDYEIVATNYNDWYRTWGFYPSDTTIPQKADGFGSYPHSGWSLADYKKAGAIGVIFSWTNVSDEQATGQNWPFGQPLQDIPALFVGRDTGAKIRQLASGGGAATLTLEADVFPNAGTDSLIATLPGASNDEVLIVHTHTDGPNAIQENGGVALVALAKYFSKIPQSSRKRTLVFSLISGHDNNAYLPGKQGGFIERHPDVLKKAVAAVSIEHVGCNEWHDDESHMRYAANGKPELSYAITHHETLAKLDLESMPGTTERRVAVVEPTPVGRYLGIGGSLASTGMPTLGYFGAPSYLNTVAADGCISRLSRERVYGQITTYAKLLHKLDVVSASDLKWLPAVHRSGAASG
jgi:hypothetical protein